MVRIEKPEVQRILEMHLKHKKNIILEQDFPDADNDANPNLGQITGVKSGEGTTNMDNNQDAIDLKLIRDAEKVGCLKNGRAQYLKGTKKPVYVVRGAKTGKTVVFYPDMTYKFTDGSKSGKWKCSKLQNAQVQQTSQQNEINQLKTQFGWKTREDLKNITQEELTQLYQKHPKFELYKLKVESGKTGGYTEIQQKFIEQAEAMGYKLQLTPEETASGKYKQYKVPNSENFFPGGLTMFYSAETAVTSGSDIQQSFSELSQGQAPRTRKECAETIKSYYEAWETRREIPQNVFDPMKRRVQACVNTYGRKFNSLGGLFSKVDNYIDTLSGGSGGPLTYGEDAKWRIAPPRKVKK
jgi:hypothetical protein